MIHSIVLICFTHMTTQNPVQRKPRFSKKLASLTTYLNTHTLTTTLVNNPLLWGRLEPCTTTHRRETSSCIISARGCLEPCATTPKRNIILYNFRSMPNFFLEIPHKFPESGFHPLEPHRCSRYKRRPQMKQVGEIRDELAHTLATYQLSLCSMRRGM